MPDNPRGVTGPKSASLKDPTLPPDLQVGDQVPPVAPQPKFGPADEFPESKGSISDTLSPEDTGAPIGVAEPGFMRGGNVSDQLSLAPDNGPPRSRVDVTENGPAAAEGKFKDHSLVPGAERIESDSGFVDVLKNPDRWEIKQTFTDPAFRRQGLAEQRLAETAQQAQSEGVDLVSDKSVHPDVLKMYRKARDKGLITFDESNPKRVDEAIAANSPARSDVPIFQNIRPANEQGLFDRYGGQGKYEDATGSISDALDTLKTDTADAFERRSGPNFEARRKRGMQFPGARE
jgi:GNAT superfamily N-acetyltransferase